MATVVGETNLTKPDSWGFLKLHNLQVGAHEYLLDTIRYCIGGHPHYHTRRKAEGRETTWDCILLTLDLLFLPK